MGKASDKRPGLVTGKKARKYCKSNKVNFKNLSKPVLAKSFQLFSSEVIKVAQNKAFETPTVIQAAAWPQLLNGKDVLAIAETGSGKTLGFTLPLIELFPQKTTKPLMLVVAPTRELAMQISEVINEWSPKSRTALVVGGCPKGPQRGAVVKAKVIVGTPGRLQDLLEEGSMDLSGVKFFVLDEADRLLDRGFLMPIESLFEATSAGGSKPQVALFSATWPETVHNLGRKITNDPVKIFVGFDGDADDAEASAGEARANVRVTQEVEVIGEFDRLDRAAVLLPELLKAGRCICFVLYKLEAGRIEQSLRKLGYRVVSVHGDKSQPERTEALSEFQEGRADILVATDVAARGLDLPDVGSVLNYSFPLTIEDYVHRIGRTGRAGKSGRAVTFFHQGNKPLAGELQALMRSSGMEGGITPELEAMGTTTKRKRHPLYGDIGPRDDRPMAAPKHVKFDD